MEAAGFLPGTHQLLSIFADGLPTNTVSFINFYDNIISSLNELNEQALPNIHDLFDHTIHIENNMQHVRIMNISTCPCPPTTPTSQLYHLQLPVPIFLQPPQPPLQLLAQFFTVRTVTVPGTQT